MKKNLILLLFSLLTSCDAVVDHIIESNTDTLYIYVDNKTQFQFQNVELIIDGVTQRFGDIAPDQISNGLEFSHAYAQVEVRVIINDGMFVNIPTYIDEDTIVIDGDYVYEISITNYNNGKLAVVRKQL